MAEKVDAKTLKAPKDVVSIDRNWTLRVNSELDAEHKWNNQWGYYAKGTSLLMQASPPRNRRCRRRRPSMIESRCWSRRSTRSRVRSTRHLPRPTGLATMWNSTRTPRTTSIRIGTCDPWSGGCPRAGRRPSGLPVLVVLFSRGPLRPPRQAGQEEVK